MVLLALWVVLPFGTGHPIVDAGRYAWTGPEPMARLDEFMDLLAAELPIDSEVALWWPERDEAGLTALAHWWALASYRLAPRKVYPLLTSEETREVEPLLDGLRPFLAERSLALATGYPEVPVVVAAWSDDCGLPGFPALRVVYRQPRGCLLQQDSDHRQPDAGEPAS